MIRRVAPYVLVTLGFLIDCTVMPLLTRAWFLPVVSLALCHALGLALGRSRGLLLGLVAGLMIDITTSTPLGRMTVICALMGWTGGLSARFMRRVRPLPQAAVSAGVAFTLYELIMDVYMIFSTAQYDAMLFPHSFVRTVIYVGLVCLMRFPLGKLADPARARFRAA